jgi:hypothetical protein
LAQALVDVQLTPVPNFARSSLALIRRRVARPLQEFFFSPVYVSPSAWLELTLSARWLIGTVGHLLGECNVTTKQTPLIQAVRSSDGVLQELVTERRRQVETLQRKQAEQLKETETRGQQQARSLMEMLGKDYAEVFRKLETRHADAAKRMESQAIVIRDRWKRTRSPRLR